MVNLLTQKELDTLMVELFSVNPKDYSFFKKCLGELIKIDEGSQLLRSLSANFKGKKLTLKIQPDLKAKGHFSDDAFEVAIRKKNLLNLDTFFREGEENYPKALFHELTHCEQYQNKACGGNAITEEDKFFTVLMAEADAQVAGDLFEKQQRITSNLWKWLFMPMQQIFKLAKNRLDPQKRLLTEAERQLKKNHPDWSEEQIKKETKKEFFKKVITKKDLYWRPIYENPEMIKRATSGVYSKGDFPDVMRYYMEKYDLTLDECLALKKEILGQSNQNFLKKEESQINKRKTDNLSQTASTSHIMQRLQRVSCSNGQIPEESVIASKKTIKNASKVTPAIFSRFEKGGQGE